MSEKSLIHQLVSGDYRKPTAVTYIRHPLSPESIPILEICDAIVQLSNPNKDGFYTFPKKLAKSLRGWNRSNNYSVEKAFSELYENNISWNIFDKDGTLEPCDSRFIINIAGHKTRNRNVYFGVNPIIERVLKSPKNYARPEVLMMFILNKPQGLFSLYSALMDAIARGEKGIFIPLSYLRNIFGLKEGQYPSFKDFNKRKLRPGIESINRQSNIFSSYEPRRKGRKIEGVWFAPKLQAWQQSLFLENALAIADILEDAGIKIDETANLIRSRQKKILSSIQINELPKVWKKVIDKGLGEGSVKKYYQTGEYSEALVAMILKEVEEYGKTTKIFSVGATLQKAFQEKWGEKKLIEIQQKEATQEIKQQEQAKKLKADDLEKEFDNQKKEKIQKLIAQFSDTERQEMEDKFQESIHFNNSLVKNSFRNGGMDAPAVKFAYMKFIENNHLSEEERNFELWRKSNKVA